MIRIYKLCSKNVTSVIWGSDIFKSKKRQYKRLSKIFLNSDIVNCCTPEIEKALNNLLKSTVKIRDFGKVKISRLKFGVLGLDYVKDVLENPSITFDSKNEDIKVIEGAKKENKIIVTIGYNGSRNQQHLKIISAIAGVENINNYFFVVPMTYGSDEGYYNDILNFLKSNCFNFVVIRKFLDNYDVASLRILTDMFIQLQITDAFSASMMEHLYAGSSVITGKWLNYVELQDSNLSLVEISSFSQLPEALKESLEIKNNYISGYKLNSQRDYIWNLCSFNVMIDNWLEL
ncbi:hypothetical protein [Shewanella baltica]|uniref:hypothetical protein n=1 Tax=Shewanella baltica TaxID=62322 RepID=UPI000F84AFA4|nr:hypothetical protein [Shewanella baltica]